MILFYDSLPKATEGVCGRAGNFLGDGPYTTGPFFLSPQDWSGANQPLAEPRPSSSVHFSRAAASAYPSDGRQPFPDPAGTENGLLSLQTRLSGSYLLSNGAAACFNRKDDSPLRPQLGPSCRL